MINHYTHACGSPDTYTMKYFGASDIDYTAYVVTPTGP